MRASEELSVITKTYDLVLWFVPIIGRFPRAHRFVLGERMERNLYDLLETLLRAKYQGSRQGLLADANMILEILRFQCRMAKDLDLMNAKRYGHVSGLIEEIGCEVGGWLKKQTTRAK